MQKGVTKIVHFADIGKFLIIFIWNIRNKFVSLHTNSNKTESTINSNKDNEG